MSSIMPLSVRIGTLVMVAILAAPPTRAQPGTVQLGTSTARRLNSYTWSQYGHDATHTHRSLLQSSPQTFANIKTVWPSGRIQSSPAVASDGRVYIGTDNNWLYSYDLNLVYRWQ